MLSSAKIRRSSWRYYQQTVAVGACEYYTERGDRPGRWYGAGLAELGLTAGAEVEERELEALFGRALSPTTGQQLGASWRQDAVTGFDLTFSAPKSVSALWALAGPNRAAVIEGAHAAAVEAALGYLEAHAALSRRGKDGVEQIGSAGFVAALFDHITSRTGDPQLHTHALGVNKVRCADGSWRSLDGHEVYHHKKSAGAVYQAGLRVELSRQLNIRFGPVNANGQAEIAGIPERLTAAWSTRTAAVMDEATPTIADAEAALGRDLSAAERARVIKTAVLATRPPKDRHISHRDLRDRWRAQAAQAGWDERRLVAAVLHAPMPPIRRPDWAIQTIREAVTATGRSKAVWSRADLAVRIAAGIPADLGPDSLDGLCMDAAQAAQLIEALTDRALGNDRVGAVSLGPDQAGVTPRASDTRYASEELVELEARILERAITGGFRNPGRLNLAVVARIVGENTGVPLSGEQRQAAVRLVASRDLLRVMTAPAGAGKTTTLAAATRLWRARDMQVVSLAPSARAAAELSAATGTEGQTVARWLLQQRRLDEAPDSDHPGRLTARSVLVVDEASMLTTADLDQLTARAQSAGAALVLVGDPAQIGSVNAPGGMFELLCQRMGPWTVALTELHRFRQPWEGAATLRLRDGDPDVLTEYVRHKRIHPAASSDEAADAVFERWAAARADGRDALMLARSWSDVTALNARARAAAAATGAVTGPALATITSRTPSTGGHPERRTWRHGDLLLAKRNDPRITIGSDTVRNGDRFRVTGAAPDGLVVEDLRGRGATTLPLSYLTRHTEYGWAATVDGAQGATADLGILLARSGLDREHLYVGMTRGRQQNHVHTSPESPTGDAGPHHTSVRPLTPDQALEATLAMLASAVQTSGRERAAHTLLDAPVHAARERAWAEREDQQPEPPLPGQHRRHLDDLARAEAELRQARQSVHQLAAETLALEQQRDQLPPWARGRRRDVTRRIESNEHGWYPQQVRTRLEQAGHAVDAAAGVVSSDAAQRAADAHLNREWSHRSWLGRPEGTYLDPNLDQPEPIEGRPAPTRPQVWRQPPTLTPPDNGWGRSI